MLQMLAFVVLSAINEHQLFESARLTASHDIIQSETDILINMFGNLEIFYLICALFHQGLPDMAKSQIQTAKNYLTEDEYSDLVKYLAQRPDVPAGFQLQ